MNATCSCLGARVGFWTFVVEGSSPPTSVGDAEARQNHVLLSYREEPDENAAALEDGLEVRGDR